MTTAIVTKTAQVIAAMQAGDHRTALKIAAKFRMLGEHRNAIQRGWAAVSNPAFYRSLGDDPERLVQVGLVAIRTMYHLPQE